LDDGINFLNTGDFYGTGHNEMLVGEQLKVTAETKSLFLSSLGDWLLQMACLTV
jgi:aryl-alcohol dehydrogenase-like predicted oxidoreductase